MSKKRTIVTIIFNASVDLEEAQGIVKKIFQDVASYLAHKKFKTIKTGNIPAWRKGVTPLVGYHGKGKGCRAMCSFVEEGDAISLEEYLHGTYLRQRSELKNKIALIE